MDTSYGTLHSIDSAAVRAHARAMSIEALAWSARDAWEAAQAAENLEAAGFYITKSGGFYRDEASAYRAELRRREVQA